MVTDVAAGESQTRTVSLTVTPVADLDAQDDSFSTDEDTPVSGSVAANDSTTSGGVVSFAFAATAVTGVSPGPLSYALETAASHGATTVNADGTFTYTPNGNYNGTDSFTYRVTDAVAGESAVRTVSLTINPVNDPPAIGHTVGGASNSISYAEQGAAVFVDHGIAVTDPDSTTLVGATLTITGGLQAGDVLRFANQSGIAGSYANGVLTLTGLATLAAYQTALPSVTFDNLTNDDPTQGGANVTRTIEWQTDDGQASNNLSNISTTTINVAAVNDAPVNHVPGAQHTQPNTDHLIAGLSVSDVDAANGTLATTLSVGHGTLTVASLGGALVSGSGTGSVSLAGTVAQINAALANNVVYHGAAGFHGSDALTVQTSDGGNTGGGALTDTGSVAITLSHALPLLPQGDGHFDRDLSGGNLLRDDDGTFFIADVTGGQIVGHLVGAVGNEWRFVSTGDFNHDGTNDLLSVRDTDGMLVVHAIQNNHVSEFAFLGPLGTDWSFRAAGDFNHDGTSDLLWQQQGTGQLLIHDIQNSHVVGSAFLGAIGTDWKFLGTADFNRDGTADLLWQQQGTEQLVVHSIQNNQVAGANFLGAIGSDWHFAGTGDFNGDHTADMLFQHDDGTLRVYDIVNNQVAGSYVLETLANDTHIAGMTDYTGDGTDDLLLRHDDGTFELHRIQGNVVAQTTTLGQSR